MSTPEAPALSGITLSGATSSCDTARNMAAGELEVAVETVDGAPLPGGQGSARLHLGRNSFLFAGS